MKITEFSKGIGNYLVTETTGDLPVSDATTLILSQGVNHIVWLTPELDKGLASFAGNFGVTFQHLPDGTLNKPAIERIRRANLFGRVLFVGNQTTYEEAMEAL